MATFPLSLTDDAAPSACRGGVLTIGNFDGVHLGHQALVQEAVRQARDLPGPAVAITFDPHPLQLLKPNLFQPVLTSLAERTELLHRAGADQVIVLQTTPTLLQLRARAFFEQIIQHRLDARAIVEGFNFAFGHDRQGTVQTLQELGSSAGVRVTLVPPQEVAGGVVSSSRVRRELEAGEVKAAQVLLGRPHRIAGLVGPGERRGQTLGFPTANLTQVATLLPGQGVYAVRVAWNDRLFAGAANIGPNPTFGEHALKIEVHLCDFQGDLYGQTLTVEFLERLRGVQTFPSRDALIRQLQLDVRKARSAVPPS